MAEGRLSFLAPPKFLMIHWFSPFGYRYSAPAEMIEYFGDRLVGRFLASGSPSYFEQEREFMVTIPVEQTIYHQGGRVSAFDPTSLIFRTVLDPNIRRTQQRKTPRVTVELPVTRGKLLTAKGHRSSVLDLQVKDLSSGGLRMESETTLNKGDLVSVDLKLDEDTPVNVTVYVTNCAEVGRGIGRFRLHGRFEKVSQDDMEKIEDFVRAKLASVDRRYTVRTKMNCPATAYAFDEAQGAGERISTIVNSVSDKGLRFIALSPVRRGLNMVFDLPGWTGRKESITDAFDRKIREVATIDGFQTEVRLRAIIMATPEPAPGFGDNATSCAAVFYKTDETIRHEMLEYFLR